MSRITEVTAEAFEKLTLKTRDFKTKQKVIERVTNQIKQDTAEVNRP